MRDFLEAIFAAIQAVVIWAGVCVFVALAADCLISTPNLTSTPKVTMESQCTSACKAVAPNAKAEGFEHGTNQKTCICVFNVERP